jgi:hypothetical protein
MERKYIAIIAVIAMIAIAGCTGVDGGESQSEDIESSSNVEANTEDIGESYWFEIGVTESNQQNLVQKRPPFKMDDSLERQNLIQRYEYLNDQNNVHHVYMLSHDGKVIDYSVAQGKISSVNSKLTNDKQIVYSERCLDTTHGDGEGACFKTVESPQMDGSYGTNGNAIFWFTTEGHYMEWNGLYVVSEEPKGINTQVTLTDEVDTDS